MLNFALNVGSTNEQTIGVPPENVEELVRLRTKDLADLSESQKDTISLLKEKLDLNERQLRAAFGIVGEANVPPERLTAKLVGIAEQIKALRAENEQLRRGPPPLAAIVEAVQALLDKGEFGEADHLLARGREAARSLRIDASRYEAALLAQRARVDDLQLAYRTAAAKYAEAAALVAPFDTVQQWRFLLAQAGELLKQGDEFGDNGALAEAIDIYQQCITLVPRSERPLDWAVTQVSLGNALVKLGERERGTARLEEAVAAFREALQKYTPARAARLGRDSE
jgi:tetratricopeptide (TPR) repeat protein